VLTQLALACDLVLPTSVITSVELALAPLPETEVVQVQVRSFEHETAAIEATAANNTNFFIMYGFII
jgi:hypothetical protein